SRSACREPSHRSSSNRQCGRALSTGNQCDCELIACTGTDETRHCREMRTNEQGGFMKPPYFFCATFVSTAEDRRKRFFPRALSSQLLHLESREDRSAGCYR